MVGNSSKDMAIVRLVPREEGEAECSIPSPTHGRYKNICPERNIAGVDGSGKAYTRDIRRQGEVEYHHLTHGPKLGVDRAKDIRRQGEVESGISGLTQVGGGQVRGQ